MIGFRKLALSLGIGTGVLLSFVVKAADKVDHALEPWPLGDIYDVAPPRAQPTPGTSCVYANRYFTQNFRERHSLFAEDAVYLDPDGNLIRGRQAIGDWFAGTNRPRAAATPSTGTAPPAAAAVPPPAPAPATPPVRATGTPAAPAAGGGGGPIAFYAAGNDCFVVILGPSGSDPRQRLRVVDQFTMDDKGLIVRAVFYFRTNAINAARGIPGPTPPAAPVPPKK